MQTRQQQFSINDKPYYFIGTNMWYAGIIAMPDNKGGDRTRLLKELDLLKSKGINNLRVLAGAQGQEKIINGVQPVHPALQTAPGVYNDDLLEGMDFLLQQLEKRKMYAVFFFTNNWEWSGGMLQYLNWHGKISDTALAKKYAWDEYRAHVSGFYSCEACKNDYWSLVKHILQRTNKLTGRKYTTEPAIMAWEVANEPRPMLPTAINDYKTFLQKTTALIKQLDPAHLLTLGVEGYMGTENMQVFEEIHRDEHVDYATIHIWPKNWGWYKDSSFAKDITTVINKTAAYINEHATVMERINKPLVLEEFGLPRDGLSFSLQATVNNRDQYYRSIFDHLLKSKNEAQCIAGVNFWAFGGLGKPAKNATPFWKEGDDLLGDPPMEEQGLNAVFATDISTWKMIGDYTALLKK
ncbi:glycoside hydrolase 5 family protein [Ferruginibacter sp.]